jgi:hypothetical protein
MTRDFTSETGLLRMPENTLDNPSKLVVRVQFPSPAPSIHHPSIHCYPTVLSRGLLPPEEQTRRPAAPRHRGAPDSVKAWRGTISASMSSGTLPGLYKP